MYLRGFDGISGYMGGALVEDFGGGRFGCFHHLDGVGERVIGLFDQVACHTGALPLVAVVRVFYSSPSRYSLCVETANV